MAAPQREILSSGRAWVDSITTTDNDKGTAAVRREFLEDARPAATGVIVAGLLRAGALLEISAVAVLKG
ncbi:MAG TPA: hypothetical protein VMR23_00655 [Candidatus Limnocylindria bacterium]|nr:hypothetical protein [Candidatus Limnocylindria bacterium]